MCPVRDVPCRSGAGWPMPLLPALRTRRRDALQRVSAERGAISHRMFAAALRMSEADGTVASPPVYAEVPPPRGVRSRAARPGTDAARSQLSGTGRANMAEILACRGADAPTARPPSQDNRSRGERLSAAPCRFRPAVFRTAFRRIRRQNPGTALSCPSPPRSDRGGRRIPSARTGSGSAV